MSPSDRARRFLAGQSLLVAGACVVVDVLAFVVQGLPPVTFAWVVALLAVIVADALLATPTRWSGWVTAAAVAVNAGCGLLLGGPPSLRLNEAGVLVASYRAGAWLRGIPAVVSLAVVIGGIVAAFHARGYPLDWYVAIAAIKTGLVPWVVGRYTTARREFLDELRRQAEQEERDARDAVSRAIATDRAGIARDLHDVVTHHVSAISVHAGAARLRLAKTDADPAALLSLRSVEEASRSALGDLRNMLDVLHGVRSVEQLGLADIDNLLHGFRAASIPVRLHITGEPFVLPPAVDIALYRVVQEMLTNALRHGDGGVITVTVRYEAAAVEVATLNPYRASGPVGDGGRGLAGIRNRVHALGGRLHAGPSAQGRTWSTSVSFHLPELT
ncbi:histidine kinase [Winogradskya consettensis]|uniref:histidine kinase n=1 Tax=Winogradskya consettensis TaxID=113560 RepID=A0A919SQA5_9ACTN|nr:histidine kinase [Actinoplanes consettensis]GIM76355.1 two-component sensor histidine kinase [Actinoplanes consettensis]